MKRFISLIALPLLLSGCSLSSDPVVPNQPGTPVNPVVNPSDNNPDTDNNPVEDSEEKTDTESGNKPQSEEKPIEQEEEKPVEEEEEKPIEEEEEKPIEEEETPQPSGGVTTNLSLDEWKNWTFSDGNKPRYDDDWDYYYGTSFEPRGCLWENPTVEEYNGIEFFDKKQYLESPDFNTYPKVEVRFEFWFSAHDSGKYKATDNEPQFKIEEYNQKGSLINTDTIEIKRSDVPSNNKPLEIRKYITQSSMTSFNLKFNNFIPNGGTGYTAILYKVSLKGWPAV